MQHKHPKLPYKHNLDKICTVEGCVALGELRKCHICKGFKRKVKCEQHRYKDWEMRKILSGKLKV